MLPRRILQVLLAGLLAGLGAGLIPPLPSLDPPSARADGPSDWPMEGHDPGRTNYNPNEAALKPPLRLKWTFDTGCQLSAPVLAGAAVYLGGSQVSALNASAGTIRWTDARERYVYGLTEADGVLYTSGSSIWAFDGAAGILRWRYPDAAYQDPVVVDGAVYLASDRAVYSLGAVTGTLRWKHEATLDYPRQLAVAGGLVYVASSSKSEALDAATGSLRWSFQGGKDSLAVVGSALYAVAGGRLVVLNADTGAVRWQFQRVANLSSPTIADGTVYLADADGVYALDAASGNLRWSYVATTAGWTPVLSGGRVYVTGTGKLHALDAATGALQWTYELGLAGGSFTPLAAADRALYVGGTSGATAQVWAIDATSGQARWTYMWSSRVRNARLNLSAAGRRYAPAVAAGAVYLVFSETEEAGEELVALDAATGDRRWSYRTGCGLRGSPALAQDTVFAGSEGGVLYAVNPATGAIRWNYDTGHRNLSSPAVANGAAYVGSWDGRGDYATAFVHAVDASTGGLRWKYDTTFRGRPGIDTLAVAAADETVYVTAGSQLRALDAVSGTLKWLYDTVHINYPRLPAVAGSAVYVSSRDTGGSYEVVALDAITGALMWSYQVEFPDNSPYALSAPVVGGSLVFAIGYTGTQSRLFALDAATGAVRWRVTFPSYSAGVLATGDGTLYIEAGYTSAGGVVALEAATGALKWRLDPTGLLASLRFCAGAAGGGSQILYGASSSPYGTTAATVAALDTASGTIIWSGKHGFTSPSCIVAGGMLLLKGYNQSLIAWQTASIANLSLTKVAAREVYPGEALTYAIYLENSGGTDISVALTDTIPFGTSLITETVTGGAVYSPTINSILWSGTVPNWASSILPFRAFSFRVNVDESAPAGVITNTVLVSDGSTTASASASTPVWRHRVLLPLALKVSSGW